MINLQTTRGSMQDEWRYIINSQNCHINLSGEVMQNERIVPPYRNRHGAAVVELLLETNEYDSDQRRWVREPQEVAVASLMLDTWFDNWPVGAAIKYVDGDPMNCSADNLRAEVYDERLRIPRMVQVREAGSTFVFDLRLMGNVEIVELEREFSGVRAAARHVKGDPAAISRVLSGELQTHRGFHFRWSWR